MAQSLHNALCSLLSDILATPSVSIDDLSKPPHETSRLLLLTSRSAPVPQLCHVLLRILLGLPPFRHGLDTTWPLYASRFLHLWAKGQVGSSHCLAVTPAQCIAILYPNRLDFQHLSPRSFSFVSALLLSCLQRLSPKRNGRHSDNIHSWTTPHGQAISVLTNLLQSLPPTDCNAAKKQPGDISALWKCLELLVSDSSWWSPESSRYRGNLLSLSTSIFSPPIASSLLQSVPCLTTEPASVLSTTTALLEPLEKALGVDGEGMLKTLAPAPFEFPITGMAHSHAFEKDYEFASLRMLFVGWLTAVESVREREEFRAPWKMKDALTHSEAHRRLKAHPPSAGRVALIYIFNDVQKSGDEFKPSTDMRAIELLKVFVEYRYKLNTTTSPLDFLHPHAEWLLPWLWKRRATEPEFVVLATSAWLLANPGKPSLIHPGYQLVIKTEESVMGVFYDLLRRLLVRTPFNELERRQNRKLLRIVLEIVTAVAREKSKGVEQLLCMLVVKCCVASLETEWIEADGWRAVVKLLCATGERSLTEAVKQAQAVMGIVMMVPIILRHVEAIVTACTAYERPGVTRVRDVMEMLSAQTQFVVLLADAVPDIMDTVFRQQHLLAAAIHYVKTPYTALFLASSEPDLARIYSTSVASVTELLVVANFGITRNPAAGDTTAEERDTQAAEVMKHILARRYAWPCVSGALCNILLVVSKEWLSKNPRVYFQSASVMRSLFLDKKQSPLSPPLPSAAAALTRLLTINTSMRSVFVSSRWNLALSAKLTAILLDPASASTMIHLSSQLLVALLELRPEWVGDLVKGGVNTEEIDAVLSIEEAEKRVLELVEIGQTVEAGKIVAVVEAVGKWNARVRVLRRNVRRGSGNALEAGQGKGLDLKWGLGGRSGEVLIKEAKVTESLENDT